MVKLYAPLPGLETPSAHPTSSSPSSHVCPHLKCVHERANHLIRPLRSHENARLHQYTRCPKKFNRALVFSDVFSDLLALMGRSEWQPMMLCFSHLFGLTRDGAKETYSLVMTS